MIFKGSRYQNVRSLSGPGCGGAHCECAKFVLFLRHPAGFLHTFTTDERLDLLAYRFYRNPEKFWLIADANTEMDPEDLAQPGYQLLIPPDRT